MNDYYINGVLEPVLVGQGIILSILALCRPPWRRLNRSLRE